MRVNRLTTLILTGVALFILARPASGVDDLRWSTYLTADSVASLFTDIGAGAKPVERLRELRVSKVVLEVYRGKVVDRSQLEKVRDYFREHGFEVWGGIATVPGGGYGVAQKGPLDWFNFENEKTQNDLRAIAEMAANVFDTFMVDDFLCTGDISAESAAARGTRSWGEYRRDLMVRVAREVFIEPMKAVNPDITLIIKYPQWYDRFHLFGYDVPRQSAQFDLTWVGTETRGANTQRFGFTQPYEGFVNYRWIASIAGEKTAGAWFDHGDCDANDFVEQAYQTVLAGAPDIVLFSYAQLMEGHPGHALLMQEQDRLNELSKFVRLNPVQGIPAYKPANSDPAGDMYLFDFLGMMGIPLVPVSDLPANGRVVFIPAQAAHDAGIAAKIETLARKTTRIVLTAGFLAKAAGGDQLARRAGLIAPVKSEPFSAGGTAWLGTSLEWRVFPPVHEDTSVMSAFTATEPLPQPGILLEARIDRDTAQDLIMAGTDAGTSSGERAASFLTGWTSRTGQYVVLNTHTYSQADFDAVGEVLLSPRPLGLLDTGRAFADELRKPFDEYLGVRLSAPPRVTLQPIGNSDWVLHNYRDTESAVAMTFPEGEGARVLDVNGGTLLVLSDRSLNVSLPPRSRLWVRLVSDAE